MTYGSVKRWLEEHTLLERSLLEGPGIETLIAERLGEFDGSEKAYLVALAASPDEVDRLVAGVAVPETWLFRYPRSFDLLLEHCRGRLEAGADTLRMVSLGCATGQEPYCMAITALHAGWPVERVHVEGMDRNRGFLRTAEARTYGASSIRGEIPPWAGAHLRRSGDSISIKNSVADAVRFTRTDITDPASLAGAGPWDVVFCRNVLIYLNGTAREMLLKAVCADLLCGGLLFVGHAEQMLHAGYPLRTVSVPHAFALERMAAVTPSLEQPPTHTPKHRPAVSVGLSEGREPRASSAVGPPVEGTVEDARVLADSGRAADGEAMVRAIIGRHGPTGAALELLGMIRASVNDDTGAKRLFEQAVYLEPSRSASLVQLALISERSGDAERAESYWSRVRRASPFPGPERRP